MTSSATTPDDRTPRRVPVVDEAEVAALRADLAAFTVDAVEALLRPVASAALQRGEPTPALRATAGPDVPPVATLVRAFLLGEVVTRADLERALPTAGAAGALALGLVARADDVDEREAAALGRDSRESAPSDAAPPASAHGSSRPEGLRPLVDLRPWTAVDGADETTWWVASDLGELATGGPLGTDHVLGIGGASVTLAAATVPTRVDRVLDLGTGCGVQALHASRHARHVTATDVSDRALAFAAFNLSLAGLDPSRVDLRRGSLLEPVAGEVFDLVVSNPPFVITPRMPDVPVYEYRDGGRAGDSLVEELVTGVGDVLAPGGVAQLLANWEVHGQADWTERIGAWVDASGLDAWVVQRELLDPAQYAETWIRDAGTTAAADRTAWRSLYGAWLDDLASRDVTAIGFGIVTLRRPSVADEHRPRLRRLEELTNPLPGPVGPAIAAGLAAHDWLAARDDEAFVAEHLVVAPDVTEERHLVPGESDPRVVLLRQGGGFGRAVQVGTAVAGLVGACDGELSVGTLVGALGALLDRSADDVAREVLPTARGLVADGFLLPS
ncbi:MAG: SAM-dependent methyltransferase [Cellulomonas sp. 73-145]|uniref:DUF7059 domain-containing protein n=1 Tax=Cellulomonas sp. 73-145 TaxID=1895739 RepID=UPI000928C8FD|nr:methyltransferase [Cellulomonas sp. 73-145]OJV60366.1 MAG: SAM-dependent methyltransferase [Cellulomonas sp. 73-145]